ncbi:MAG: ABC transporter substrate-binding protein [Alphaproteobacteria bacterium]|nr:MAG: ABC transporter substrate-binding protein [Alphaproteobacteria bacterium]
MLRGVRAFFLMLALPLTALPARADLDEPQTHCLKLGADESLGASYDRFEALFEDLYGRAGLCAKSVPMDPKRIEQLLDLGDLDGDWFRPADYVESRHKMMLQLQQPILGLESRLVWLASSDFSGQPADLKGRIVGYQAGFRWLEGHIPRMGGIPFAVSSTAQIRGLLERGRIDVFATSSVHEPAVLETFGKDMGLVHQSTWAAVPFYHLLHPRHEDKVARLNDALKQMIESHAIEAYLDMPGVMVMPVQAD